MSLLDMESCYSQFIDDGLPFVKAALHEPVDDRFDFGLDLLRSIADDIVFKISFDGFGIAPNDEATMPTLLKRAKKKLGLAKDARVVSCCEAGRGGFWPHRFQESLGIENIVIDAASMKVSRHGRPSTTPRPSGQKHHWARQLVVRSRKLVRSPG